MLIVRIVAIVMFVTMVTGLPGWSIRGQGAMYVVAMVTCCVRDPYWSIVCHMSP